MKLFKKRGGTAPRRSTSPRRNARLGMLRFKKTALFCGTALLVLGGGFYGWHSGAFSRAHDWMHDKTMSTTAAAGFKVDQILVTGRTNIDPAVLMSHLGLHEGEPIFDVSVDAAQKSLMEISWVKDARVTRRLPDTIIVDLTERTPAALWQYQNDISVIAQDGRVLSSGGRSAFQALPLVVGENAPAHLSELMTLLHAEPQVAEQLVSAVRIGQRRWDLHLKNNITVKLPEKNPELALSKLARSIKTEGLLKKDIASVDLRMPHEMVIEPASAAPEIKDKKKKT